MSSVHTTSNIKQAAISLVVNRSDGTVEDLGVVCYTAKNPLRVLWFKLQQKLGRHVPESAFFNMEFTPAPIPSEDQE